MKNIIPIAILFASTCIGASSASAQDDSVRVAVPFNFTVNSKTLPAGTYNITPMGSSSIIKIANLTNSRAHVFAIGQGSKLNPASVNTVVFHHFGARYFLSDIRGDAYSPNLHVPTSKEEKRAKAQMLEAGLQNSETILLALR